MPVRATIFSVGSRAEAAANPMLARHAPRMGRFEYQGYWRPMRGRRRRAVRPPCHTIRRALRDARAVSRTTSFTSAEETGVIYEPRQLFLGAITTAALLAAEAPQQKHFYDISDRAIEDTFRPVIRRSALRLHGGEKYTHRRRYF